MIRDRVPAFDNLPNTLNMSRLEQLSRPAHKVLSDLIARCSSDSNTCAITATALVLILWQLRGRTLTEHVPSLILLNAGEAAPDPIDDFIRSFVQDKAGTPPGKGKDRRGLPIDPEKAPQIMTCAIMGMQELGRDPTSNSVTSESAQMWQGRYHDAQRVAYGTGVARPYSRAWDKPFGFITDTDDRLIARLNEAPDRAAFRHDVLDDRDKLWSPMGIGAGLQMVPKSVTVSGSLTVDLWDGKLVKGIIKLGLPILFIPHTVEEPLTIANAPALESLPDLWCSAPVGRAKTSLKLPPNDWFQAHAYDIRRRLRLLPGSGDYEFAVLQVLRQLFSVCHQITLWACNYSEADRGNPGTLQWALYAAAFRGITLSVAALAWHGLGFDPGCPAEKAVKVLRDLRTKGPLSVSDILRCAHLKKEQRNLLLERLTAEDLIRVDGKTVTATTFDEFVTALQSRSTIPPTFDCRKAGGADGETPA